jgi:hypothetical protein
MTGVLVSIIWLCGMVLAALFMRDSRFSARTMGIGALVYAAALPLSLLLSPQPNWVGVLLLLIALWRVAKGARQTRDVMLAALCAALVSSLQIAGGLSHEVAVIVAVFGLICGAILPRGGGAVASADMATGRIMAAALLAFFAGMASDFLYGWNAALVIMAKDSAPIAALPSWTVGIIMLALVAGMIRGMMAKR